MARLSACYFCGTALDEPLEDYPVAPADTRNGADAMAITLCSVCEEKLERVLTHVIDVDDRETVAVQPDSETPPPETTANGDGAASTAGTSSEDVADGGTRANSDGDGTGLDPSAADAAGEQETAEPGNTTQRSVIEGDHDVSALEYNKVMRLLQNREFPLDRDEIVTVATNAYGLERAECAKVIDVAIDRGLIEQSDGKLRRPDNH